MKLLFGFLFLAVSISSFGQRSFNVSTVPPGSYATTAAQIAAKQDSLNWHTPEMYGAVGDGYTDDAPAFNAMMAAMTSNSTISLSAKTYVLNSTWFVTKNVKIEGVGIGSIFKCGTNNIVMIDISADYVTMRDFFMYNLFTPTSGCAIKIDSSVAHPTPIAKFTMDNITINQYYNSVEAVNTYMWSITNCQFNFINYAILVSCTGVPDAGDSHISGCYFQPRGGFTGNTAIYQTNSGGLRIINNKFNYNSNQKYAYAYYGAITGTSDLLISCNSFENYTISAIKIHGSSSSRFSNISITGNQFSGLTSTTRSNIVIDTSDNISITGNVFGKYSSASDTAITLTNVTYSTIYNTYYNYGVGVYYYGTASNIVGDGAGWKLQTMTKAQRDALSSPPAGFMIYQTDNTPGIRVRNGSAWIKFSESTD